MTPTPNRQPAATASAAAAAVDTDARRVRRRVVWRVVSLAVALVVIASLGVAIFAWRQNPPPVIGPATASPTSVHIGDRVTVHATVDLPWSAMPGLTGELRDATPAEGAQLPAIPPPLVTPEAATVASPDPAAAVAGSTPLAERVQLLNVTRRRGAPGLHAWRWDVTADLQPLELGHMADMLLYVPILDVGGGPRGVVAVPVPPFDVTATLAPGATGNPSLAAELQHGETTQAPAARWWPWLAIGLAVVLAAILLWLRWQRRPQKAAPEVPPWIAANASLDSLAARLPLPAEPFFSALTDIVRRYLELRFHLPATEETTPEFLRTVNRDGSPLDSAQRDGLATFLNTADRVKFARAEVDAAALRDALATARQLIAQTTPLHDAPVVAPRAPTPTGSPVVPIARVARESVAPPSRPEPPTS